jgi:hypothetical protein
VVSGVADMAADVGLEEWVENADKLVAGVVIAAFEVLEQLSADFRGSFIHAVRQGHSNGRPIHGFINSEMRGIIYRP